MAIAPKVSPTPPTAPRMLTALTLPPVPTTPPVTTLTAMAVILPPIPPRRSRVGTMVQEDTTKINKEGD